VLLVNPNLVPVQKVIEGKDESEVRSQTANPKSRKRFDRDRWVKTVTDAERGFAEELTRFFDRQRQDIASRVEKLVTIRNADPELITFEIYNPTQWQAELEKVILGQGM